MGIKKMFSIKPFSDDYGKWRFSYNVGSFQQDKQVTSNILKIHIAGKWVVDITLPPFIKAKEEKVYPLIKWSEEDIKRIGSDYYINFYPKEYGITLETEYMMLSYGVYDVNTNLKNNKRKYIDYPWKAMRFHKLEYLDLNGKVWSEEVNGLEFNKQLKDFEEINKYFVIEDHDNERIIASTHLTRRTWKRGGGLFKWLSLFMKDHVRTCLEIEYSAEVGPSKGSYKGGIVGESCELLPQEEKLSEYIHDVVFARHCQKKRDLKSGRCKGTGYQTKLLCSGSRSKESLECLLNKTQ